MDGVALGRLVELFLQWLSREVLAGRLRPATWAYYRLPAPLGQRHRVLSRWEAIVAYTWRYTAATRASRTTAKLWSTGNSWCKPTPKQLPSSMNSPIAPE